MTNTNYLWVPAAPFRALLVHLIELSGLPWPVLAQHAGLPPSLVERLLSSPGRALRRIPPECARRLLALDEAQLRRLGRLQHH